MSQRVWLSEAVFRSLVDEAKTKQPEETGGLLFGYRAKSGVPVITGSCGPGPQARHSEHHYVPDYAYHADAAVIWWKESKGTEFYLGDWHSHPQEPPYLSDRDRSALNTIAKSRHARLTRPLMAVVGRSDPWAIAFWRYHPAPLQPTEVMSPWRCDICEVELYSD